uniref:Arachidonate 12-lipoxygenase n=1 Tax=Myripristis murdjan TaxID=586833 RepID=A0A667Y170_9TELE
MEVYTVTVATGTSEYSGTNNYIYVTLVGEKGESERTLLDNPGLDFCRGAVINKNVCSPSRLGSVLLVRLEKQRYWVEDNWFCRYVTVKPPDEDRVLTFPCYRWLIGDIKVELREGTGTQYFASYCACLCVSVCVCVCVCVRWVAWAPGIPKCIDASTEADLHQDVRFDNEKRSDFEGSLHYTVALSPTATYTTALFHCNHIVYKTVLYLFNQEYCMEHWKEDWFFGYQCLNGSNPRMIQRCKQLPENFPVTADMVQGSLYPRTNLDKELKAGNIYLVDYAIMEEIPVNVIRGKPQHIAAPLCLLYQHPDQGLIPIAIQLGQVPGLDTPIFLPKDPPLAWLLAKIWVRHSEFQIFQVLSHLLRTHLVVEVFCVATLRQLPAVHPVFKLLAPHLRYTLEINCRGRTQLISADGIFKRVVSTGGDGLLILAQREYKVLTYRSLQPCLDFHDRGVSQLRDYFYREHSLMLWEAIHGFVSGMIRLFYQSDSEVLQDPELQAWIKDIFDWCAWVPNTPCTMRHPPPTDKDAITMGMIMDTLPDVSQSCVEMAITWHLGRPQPDAVPLGQYTEQYFTEDQALELIDTFRKELKKIEEHILSQNEGAELPYLYLLPSRIENSITI